MSACRCGHGWPDHRRMATLALGQRAIALQSRNLAPPRHVRLVCNRCACSMVELPVAADPNLERPPMRS